MICIENAKVVLENGILWDGIILVEKDRIFAVGNRGEVEIPANAQRIDAGGAYVGPGFVDIHAHGGGGNMFWQEPELVAEHFLRRGTTSVFPTLYHSLDKQDFLTAITNIKAAMASDGAGKAIRGFYMEGPYMNPDFGASRKFNKWLGEISPEAYKEVVDEAGDLVKVWVVAPEREGIEGFVQYAKSVNPNVVFSVGHSRATPEQIRKLKKYGLNHQTHCMDATGRVSAWLGTRGAGPDEACFLDPDMYAELICDSGAVHVNADLQRLILRNKGIDKVVLISDCSGRKVDNPAPEGLRHMTDLSFDDQGNLGGSRLSMDMACRNIMTHTNCGIAQAFLMASRNPARSVGMDDEIGTIEVGKRADLVFVDDMFHVQEVMLAGILQQF
ncbi:MAG: amidohydrolase family protein [Oscillospiraceae bacterium]|nr:amidohydrolase family protein [Oscillospiraceae bacterium]